MTFTPGQEVRYRKRAVRERYRRLLAAALCRLGRHSRTGIRKYDNGRCPLLCRHCRVITGTWRP